MKRKTTPMVEFRSDDEAWYDVFINIVEGSSLKIHYKGLPKSDDQVLPLEIFKTTEDVRARFRISAEQLQDEHCRKMKKEMLISASCSSDGRDLKYFNAVVKEVGFISLLTFKKLGIIFFLKLR